jgi:hypothetical protein
MAKTLLVIGAGASNEFNLPVGDKLRQRIGELLDVQTDGLDMAKGDRTILQAYQLWSREQRQPNAAVEQLILTGHSIRDAMPLALSIDNYLDAHQGNESVELCGKLAIARAILEAERASSLFFDRRERQGIEMRNVEQTWLVKLTKMLTEGCSAPDLPGRLSEIELVIFNYDRCVEHFLPHALNTYYGMGIGNAERLVDGMNIFHPYGTIGLLPRASGKPDAVAYGADVTAEKLLEIINGIKTFAEGTNETESRITSLRTSVRTASRIVFLGFAFHRMNLDVIAPMPPVTGTRNIELCLGTGWMLSDSNQEHICRELERRMQPPERVELFPGKCAALLEQHSRALSFV